MIIQVINLNELYLDLSWCSQLSDLTPLGALEHLQNLNQLTLTLYGCSQLSKDSARTQLKGLIDLHPNAVDFGKFQVIAGNTAIRQRGSDE